MEQKEQQLRTELTELAGRLNDPAIFSSKEYPKLAKRQSELEHLLGLFKEHHQLHSAKAEATEMAGGADAELAELAQAAMKPAYLPANCTVCTYAGPSAIASR
jgi:protein subunit release factor A